MCYISKTATNFLSVFPPKKFKAEAVDVFSFHSTGLGSQCQAMHSSEGMGLPY